MNETAVGLLVGLAVAVIAVLVDRGLAELSTSRAEQKTRNSLLWALRAEAAATVHGLKELLEISEKSGHASILQFLRLAGHQASAGAVFLGLLPNLGVVSPLLVHQLAAAYVRVRVAAQMGEVLAVKKEDIVTGGEVDRVRQEVRAALAALERAEADLASLVKG